MEFDACAEIQKGRRESFYETHNFNSSKSDKRHDNFFPILYIKKQKYLPYSSIIIIKENAFKFLFIQPRRRQRGEIVCDKLNKIKWL